MDGIKLRPYQRECIETLESKGPGRWLVVMATGLGKTVTFANLHVAGRMLILSHRDELVHQPERYFDEPFGVEMASEESHGERIVSASVQTLSRDNRLGKFRPGDFECIITDEAHHALAPTYRKIIDYLEPKIHIGFTATPNRADGRGLSDVFDEIVFERDIKWGIVNGYLCDIDCRRVYIAWKTKGVKTSGGDFQIAALSERVNRKSFNEQVAEAYRKFAVGQTLVFAASVEHAYALQACIPGAHVVDGTTPAADRRELIESFTRREFPVLINYNVFTEGTDLPLIETVLLARPTKNIGLYTQMVGRGLRLAPRKEALRLIDCVGDTQDNSICTAPNLFGLDESDFSEAARRVLDGRLSELEDRMLEADDCPEGWVALERRVSLFAAGELVAWVRPSTGSRLIDLGGVRIEVEGPDLLGNYTGTFSGRSGKTDVKYPDFETIDRVAYNWLSNNPATRDMRQLWDAELAARWAEQPASRPQLHMIESLIGDDEAQALGSLTKREAVAVIENAKRKQLAGFAETYGTCPVCGQALKPSANGNTFQCSSNRWVKDEDSWELESGCGFSMPATFEGRRLPDEVVKELAEKGEANIAGADCVLEQRRRRWVVAERGRAQMWKERTEARRAAKAEPKPAKPVRDLGACPVCGKPLVVGRRGGTIQCKSNHWRNGEDGWRLTKGCGFRFNRAVDNEKLPDEVVKRLAEKTVAVWQGETYVLARRKDGSWYVFRKKE